VKIRAPAKINLRLRVVGKRDDGYHFIDTIMMPISLYDEIEITKIDKTHAGKNRGAKLRVTCDHPAVPAGRKNLVYKAAALLMQRSNADTQLRFHIHKRIPVGAGLGGGSSDAAATMIALNRLLRLKLSVKQLQTLALSLGTDVPFFIDGRPARARGIGEKLTVLKKSAPLWAVVLYPGFVVSTPWVYGNFNLKLTKPIAKNSITSLPRTTNELQKLLVNDLEVVTMRRYPQVRRLKSLLLQEGAIGALMSGTGSAVFGVFGSRQEAERAFHRLRSMDGPQVFLVHALD
jgi:4-diphosphocytidyl-2-C-methyl-D-erythritol kinase